MENLTRVNPEMKKLPIGYVSQRKSYQDYQIRLKVPRWKSYPQEKSRTEILLRGRKNSYHEKSYQIGKIAHWKFATRKEEIG
jgi:hypothetical protein